MQTPDGYIWVATLNGLARFDGVQFKVFDKSNSPGISSNRFVAMVAGLPGELWLTSEDGNLVRFRNRAFKLFGQQDGVKPGSVRALTSNQRGGVWIDSDEKAYRWNESNGRFELQSLAENTAIRIKPYRWIGTGFWALDGHVLICLTRGELERRPLPEGIRPDDVREVTMGADSALWITTSDGRLTRILDNQQTKVNGYLETPMLGPGKEKWRARIEENLDRTVFFPSGGVERGIRYNFIFSDAEDNLWIGSEGQGLFRVQRQFIKVYSTAQGLAGRNIYPVLRSKSGDMWVGSWPAGLSMIHDGSVTTYTQQNGLPGLVSSLAEDHEGNLWVGTHGGLRLFREGHFYSPQNLSDKDIPTVQVIFEHEDSSKWLGTADGIYVLDGKKSHWLTSKDGLASNDARVIIRSHGGDIWVGGYGGLTRVHKNSFQRWNEESGLPSNNVRSIYEDMSGDIWVGTYDGGLGFLHDGKWTTVNKKKGLYDDGAFQILEDDRRNLWISSNRGIYRVSKDQIYELAQGTRRRVDSVGYGRGDGMLSVECNGGLWPSGAKDTSGNLWFPTQDGVAVVNPDAFVTSKKSPRVSVESIEIDHVSTENLNHVTIRPGQSNFEVQYTALSFAKPEQIQFRYKLDGLDDDWEYVGQRRTAYYKQLRPGSYTFHVSATNSEGVPSEEDATISVTVISPIYQRWWFLCICFVVLMGVAFALWSYRLRELKRRQIAQKAFSQQLIASQESERRRIAAELHDSLGQRLIVINNLVLFLLRPKAKLNTEEDRLQTLQEISTETTVAMDETRAISYGLRPFQLDRLGLSKAIQGLARTASRASNIDFAVDVDDIDQVFPEELRINFFRIVQEAINNIIKHSGAAAAEISAKLSPSSLQLVISDNGRGLPTEPGPAIAGQGGFGLTGLQERANLLNGELKIKSQAGAGTVLTAVFTLKKGQSNG